MGAVGRVAEPVRSGPVSSTPAPSTANEQRSAERGSFDRRTTAVVRSLSLFGVMPGMVVAVVLAVLVDPLAGVAAVVVVAGAWALVVHLRARSSLERLLSALSAGPLDGGHAPRWENVVDGLGATSGVHDVELLVIDSDAANGLAAASADRRVVVVTRGLVDGLSLIELEGIAANLLGRIKDGSARYGTVVFGLIGPFLEPIDAAGRLLADGLGPQRALRSDLTAVDVTRYPPGLAAALGHLDHIGTGIDGVDPSTAHLWVAPVCADGAGVAAAVAETVLQPLSYRVAALGEL